jgi:hypothetical protein
MALTTLKDDLLQEFREENRMIRDQIELLDPLAISLRKPAAQRLISSGTLIITEIICYIISLGGVAGLIFMQWLYPFTVLRDIFYNSQIRNTIGVTHLIYLVTAIYGIATAAVVLVFILGRVAREMRLKNDILNHVGKDIKTIIGQHLERKAVLDTIEQRHMLGTSGISQNAHANRKTAINEVINPAWQGEMP